MISRQWMWPIGGAAAALIVSPVLELTTGIGETYVIWLAVVMAALWVGQKLTRREVGFTAGNVTSYVAALLYVVVIMAIVGFTALAVDAIHPTATVGRMARNIALNTVVTGVLTLVTEDGFFRGALWASFQRAGLTPVKTLIWTSVLFGLWHVTVPLIEPDFTQPLSKVPQYAIGSGLFGVAMGLLRMKSGSIVVPSICHGLWNATAYVLFGFGEKPGMLGIQDPTWLDPERGYLGFILATVAVVVLWLWVRPGRQMEPQTAG
jgi:membrane protease YdiL (CAAX protease family)